MESWSTETIAKIESKLEGVREKDIRFFRIDEFRRNIKRVDDFSANCSICRQHKTEINSIVELIEVAVKEPGKSRRMFDSYISRLAKHMQKEHGFYAPYYFTYLFSFFGITAGLLFGFVLTQIFTADFVLLYSIGFVAGLFPGYIFGVIKDKKIRSGKKLM